VLVVEVTDLETLTLVTLSRRVLGRLTLVEAVVLMAAAVLQTLEVAMVAQA
jgi:hypothetical protein